MSVETFVSKEDDQTKRLYQGIVNLISSGQYDAVINELSKLDKKLLFSHDGLLNAYGVALRSIGKSEAAVLMYQCALKLNPNHGGTWSNLGNALKDANYLNSSLTAHLHALDLSDKKDSRLWHNYGIALAIAGDHQKAIEAFQIAINLAPDKKDLFWDLARSQLTLKNYSQGFENYQYRWEINDAPPRRVIGKEWQGEPLKNQNLFIYAEQGFGDYIQCARYLPLVKHIAPQLTVEVKPELRTLMEYSYPDIKFVDFEDRKIEITKGYIHSLLDTPRFFSNDPIPFANGYLKPNPNNQQLISILRDKKLQSKNLNVCIVWSGSLTFKRNKYRSVAVEWFANNLAVPGVTLHSLQLGPRSNDVQKLPLSTISTDFVNYINNFNDTAQILKEIDLVIMTCSSCAHLSGALNVPCWILLDYSPHWLWGVNETQTEWYQSIKLFRQKSPGDWKSVFDEVSSELIQLTLQNKNG